MSRKRWLPQKGQTWAGAASQEVPGPGGVWLCGRAVEGFGGESKARARVTLFWRWALANRP